MKVNTTSTVTIVYPAQGNTVSSWVTVNWEAQDAEGDRLLYDLYVQQRGKTLWVELGTNLEAPYLDWDTSKYANGQYRLRVVAYDELGVETEFTSNYFTVDNTLPPDSKTTSNTPGVIPSSPGFEIFSFIMISLVLAVITIGKRKRT